MARTITRWRRYPFERNSLLTEAEKRLESLARFFA
jgi:hypothetical protein